MANQIYESQYIVNSFHAVNKNTNAVIPADESGYISAKAGDTIVFKNMNGDKNTDLNTLELFTKDTMLKIQVNDNSLYPFCVEPNSHKGIQYMRIYSITVLSDCTFYYEGLAS